MGDALTNVGIAIGISISISTTTSTVIGAVVNARKHIEMDVTTGTEIALTSSVLVAELTTAQDSIDAIVVALLCRSLLGQAAVSTTVHRAFTFIRIRSVCTHWWGGHICQLSEK